MTFDKKRQLCCFQTIKIHQQYSEDGSHTTRQNVEYPNKFNVIEFAKPRIIITGNFCNVKILFTNIFYYKKNYKLHLFVVMFTCYIKLSLNLMYYLQIK